MRSCATSSSNLAHSDQLGTTKMQHFLRIFCVVMLVSLLLATFAFAGTASTIETGVKSGAKQLYNIMTATILPIAAVCLGWNGYKALFGGERGMEQAKKNMLQLVVVIAIVYLAPVIITQVGGWFSSSSTWNF